MKKLKIDVELTDWSYLSTGFLELVNNKDDVEDSFESCKKYIEKMIEELTTWISNDTSCTKPASYHLSEWYYDNGWKIELNVSNDWSAKFEINEVK